MANIIYCEFCNWKKVVKDLSELQLKEIPSNDKKKRFKCPSCGRLICSKEIADSQKEVELKIKKEQQLEEYKKWLEDTMKERSNHE
jgi:UDP-N-acetylmuramate-alanine ligase